MPVRTTTDHLIDECLPEFDLTIVENLVIDAEADVVYAAARDLDFMTVRTPILAAAFFVRGLPARLTGKAVPAPPELRLAGVQQSLPGWAQLGEEPGREIVFGALGRFWKPNIEWHDVEPGSFAEFDEPGWGKIACRFEVAPDGPGRSCLTYECRTATTDEKSRVEMRRYWWLIRPFVGHIMRATLRTIATDVRPRPN